MNLYLFNDNDSSATFGIGTYLRELTYALEGANIHIHIVHLHSDCPEFEIVKTNATENWYIPEVRNHNTFAGDVDKMETYYRNVIYLFRYHIKDTSDLVFHFNYNQCYKLAKGLKEVFDGKTVTTVHFLKWALELQGNIHMLHALKSKQESERNSLEQLLYSTDEYEYLLYHEVDRVISISQYMKDLLCIEYRLDPIKIAVIPNGLADMNVNSGFDKTSLRKKWRISENESVVLFVGRLQIAKGLTFLMDAFRKVLDKIPNCRLIIAGSGHYDLCIRQAKDICTKVTFTGLLDKNELHEIYQIADVGVMPSLFETFGYVAVEMMMHGLPVVTTATSGLNEVFDETCGLKVPIIEHTDKLEIDTELLAKKIVYLLEHTAEAALLGKNARKRYEDHYSSKVFRINTLKLYTSLFETEVQSAEKGGM